MIVTFCGRIQCAQTPNQEFVSATKSFTLIRRHKLVSLAVHQIMLNRFKVC